MNRKIILTVAMTLAIVSDAWTKSEGKPPVVFTDACDCKGDHAAYRWAAKTTLPAHPIQATKKAIKPSDVFGWAVATDPIGKHTARLGGRERTYYKVTGRIIMVRLEDDCDMHILLGDATGTRQGKVIVEIPKGPQWCDLRQRVFGWMGENFHPLPSSGKDWQPKTNFVVTVTGPAFFDAEHHTSSDPAANERPGPFQPNTSIWELHPVTGIK